MKRLCLFIALSLTLLYQVCAQQYVVVSITGKVTVEDNGQKHNMRLREQLTTQSVVNIPFKGQVELLNEGDAKKITLKVPGKGTVASMMSNRQNSVMTLTKQYLAYLKDRVKGNGEIASQRYSDPATVTREIAIAEPKNPMQAKFDKFRKETNEKYERFRQQTIKRYADFVRKVWKEYGAEPPRPRPIEKTVPPVILQDNQEEQHDQLLQSSPIQIEEPVVLPVTPPQPIPQQPIKEQEEKQVEYVDFSFYGTALKVRFNGNEAFHLKGTSEKEIADTYEKLASANFNNTIRDCLELRIHHQLSDWAYFSMLDSLSHACFADGNDATLLTAYLCQQSGYKIRLAVCDGDLRMLFSTQHRIYERSYFPIDGDDYYVFGKDETRLRICEANYPEEKPLSLLIPKAMLLADDRTDNRHLQSKRYRDFGVTTNVNAHSIEFYNSYPTSMAGNNMMTRWAMYANVPFDETVNHTLIDSLKAKLTGLGELEAVERLLNWVQTAFTYEYDDKVWGGDRAFFPEETLFYPYCDCEDRSILLSRLVRDCVQLPCLLIYYPGHLAMAVRFSDNSTHGDYVELNGERYVVCDPTYIGARVGMTMPGMDNQKAKVILLK